MNSGMVGVLEKGRVLAMRMSGLAVGWGDTYGYGWRFEEAFHRFLGLGLGSG